MTKNTKSAAPAPADAAPANTAPAYARSTAPRLTVKYRLEGQEKSTRLGTLKMKDGRLTGIIDTQGVTLPVGTQLSFYAESGFDVGQAALAGKAGNGIYLDGLQDGTSIARALFVSTNGGESENGAYRYGSVHTALTGRIGLDTGYLSKKAMGLIAPKAKANAEGGNAARKPAAPAAAAAPAPRRGRKPKANAEG